MEAGSFEAPLKDLKLDMVVDTSKVDAALSGFVDAIKLADRHDPTTGRRLTTVDELIAETIEGDADLAAKVALAAGATFQAWEAVARDLARQVIDAETEIDAIEAEEGDGDDNKTELDAAIADGDYWHDAWLDLIRERDTLAAQPTDLSGADATGESRRFWYSKWLEEARARDALAIRLEAEEWAHCDTYVEAVRLTQELAGWQDSATAEYRKETAARRLAEYGKRPY